jgi:hypothetical protein
LVVSVSGFGRLQHPVNAEGEVDCQRLPPSPPKTRTHRMVGFVFGVERELLDTWKMDVKKLSEL